MPLKEQLQAQGSVFFRWRSFLPLLLAPMAMLALSESGYLVEWAGETVEETWELSCLAIALLGLGIRAFAIGSVPPGTSGRNTKEQRADVLNTTGIYATVRNPLYLGNYIILLGFVLAIKVWWFVFIASLAFALYYERIILAEEAFLQRKYAGAYTSWASRTPAFLPNPRLWRAPALAFSFRTVLRREYNGLFVIILAFTAIELVSDLLVEAEPFNAWLRHDWFWLLIFAIGTATFLTLRTLKKRTRLLHADGR